METIQLGEQLSALRSSSAAHIVQLEHELRDQEVQRTAIQAEIERLRRQLIDLNQRERALCDDLKLHAEQALTQEREIVVAALQASYANVQEMQEYWLRYARLENQRQALWNNEPALGTMLDAYRKVEENAEQYLASIPEILRDAIAQTLLAEQEKLHARIAPWLELQAQRQALRPECPLTLQLLVTREPGDTLIVWVIPFPADPTALAPDSAPVMIAAANTVVTALGSFGKYPDWSIDDLDSGAWENFSVVHTLSSYQGSHSLAIAASTLLTQLLADTEPFRNIALEVQVTEIPYEVWQTGRQGMATPQAQEQKDAAENTPDRPPVVELTRGWYTDDDVRAWARREGKFPPQARRMRTLLMRMIGRGMIGGAATPLEVLWEALPAGHDTEMRQGIATLLNAGVLQQVSSLQKDAPMVTINPAMLGEVQNLIKRETTAFWSQLTDQQTTTSAPPVGRQ